MAYDSSRALTLLFRGSSLTEDTWIWDGSSWELVGTNDPDGDGDPEGRSGCMMAYDSGRDRFVLFGGNADSVLLGDTWELDVASSSWKQVAPPDPSGITAPVPRHDSCTAYDASRERTVLFGGMATGWKSDTWEWDGTSWTDVAPTDPEGDGNPIARWFCDMAYDSTRERVVMYGGLQAVGGTNDDLWDWDGVSWQQSWPGDISGDGNPGPRVYHSMAYDNTRQRLFLYGGTSSEAYEYEHGMDQRPGQVITVPLGPATMLPGGTILSVQPWFVSGATSELGGVVLDGVSLLTWYPDGWREVATNSNPATSTGDVQFLFDQAADLTELPLQDGLHFAVVPQGTNGPGHARVSTNYAEVTVRYALP
jgi:hypothetical protein